MFVSPLQAARRLVLQSPEVRLYYSEGLVLCLVAGSLALAVTKTRSCIDEASTKKAFA